ncbi:esterase/lipase/thioesterase family protein [Gigaspora margarita]|uniref:Esterase/lipase/thioesterase family protein n=1 Tax=Gigaspora margarita TaxID=4874 RepID=A0A8H3ZYW2_GIGMA|nr:esterase/lipase/thioesterase family protein [Gigaspora margarita]
MAIVKNINRISTNESLTVHGDNDEICPIDCAFIYNKLLGSEPYHKLAFINGDHMYIDPEHMKLIKKYKKGFSTIQFFINSSQGLQYHIFVWYCLLFQSRVSEYYLIKISQFVFASDEGLQITKYSQKNVQGGIESDNTNLVIPVLSNPSKSQGLFII